MNHRKIAKKLVNESRLFIVIGIVNDRLEAITGGGISGNESDPLVLHTMSLLDTISKKVPLVNELHDKFVASKEQEKLLNAAKEKRSEILSQFTK